MIYVFHDFEFHTGLFALYRAGQAIKLRPKVCSMLTYLIDHRSRVISRDELSDTVWDGRIISNATIDSTVMAARQAIGDNGECQQIVQTLSRRGYRFIAPVNAIAEMYEQKRTALVANESVSNVTLEKPSYSTIFAQVRRATANDQIKILKWLVQEFPRQAHLKETEKHIEPSKTDSISKNGFVNLPKMS